MPSNNMIVLRSLALSGVCDFAGFEDDFEVMGGDRLLFGLLFGAPDVVGIPLQYAGHFTTTAPLFISSVAA